jgi:hypothetical protein
MKPTIRLEVQELISACKNLAKQKGVLTVRECQALTRCIREIEKLDRHDNVDAWNRPFG